MYRIFLAAFVGLGVSQAAFAETARDRLEAFSNGLVGLSGRFEQRTLTPDGDLQEESKGTLALRAPRQFRWQYEDPFAQLIVADGNNIWIYDEDLEQVTVRSQSQEESQSPLTVLIDLSQLDRDFKVQSLPESEGLLWLELKPVAKEPGFKNVRIGLGTTGPQRMSLVDLIENRTEWTFSAWHRNPQLADSAFQFTPPKGVDVVGEPVIGAEVKPLR
jgi:outer membrane lipoprotein carrier protein